MHCVLGFHFCWCHRIVLGLYDSSSEWPKMLNRQANRFWDRGCAKDFGWLDNTKWSQQNESWFLQIETSFIACDPTILCVRFCDSYGKNASESCSSESVLIKFFQKWFNCHFISSEKFVFLSLKICLVLVELVVV